MSILITGGTGSFGKTMLKHLLSNTDQEIRILSRDEEKQCSLRNEIGSRRVKFFIGDVRNIDSVQKAVRGVKYFVHALKQVPSGAMGYKNKNYWLRKRYKSWNS